MHDHWAPSAMLSHTFGSTLMEKTFLDHVQLRVKLLCVVYTVLQVFNCQPKLEGGIRLGFSLGHEEVPEVLQMLPVS